MNVCSCCVCVKSSSHFCTSEQGGELNRLHIDNYRARGNSNNDHTTTTTTTTITTTSKEPERTAGKKRAEERHVDSWAKEGVGGHWTRVHRSARRALFIPFKVAGGPSAKTPLKRIRITRGKYISGGKTFKIIDDWTFRANAHRVLEGGAWLGTTDFREIADFIDDDSDDDNDHEPTAESEPAASEGPPGGTAAEPTQTGEPEYFVLSPGISPTKSDAVHPEDLLLAAPKTAAGEAKSDRGPPNRVTGGSGRLGATERRDNVCNLSTPSRRHGVEGECRDLHTERMDSNVLSGRLGGLDRTEADRDARRADPRAAPPHRYQDQAGKGPVSSSSNSQQL